MKKADSGSAGKKPETPGIAEASKKIKKKQKKKSAASSKHKKGRGRREEEEGAILPSDAEQSVSAMLADGAVDARFEVGGLEKFPLSVVLTMQDNAFFNCSRRGVHLLREAEATLGGRVFPLVLRFYLVPELNVLSVEAKHAVFRSEEVLCALYAQDWGREITLRERCYVQSREGSPEKVFLWMHFYAGHH